MPVLRPVHALVLATMAAALIIVPAAEAQKQAWPDKPIRLVIGSAAGSGPDIISRVMADRLYKTWGQRVVVDPRPGVAGILSAEIVKRSAPDGYTWMMLTSQLLVATQVYPNPSVNLAKDFSSVSLIGSVPFVLVVYPDLPAKSISELIDLAKKQPLRYGSAGTGASEHLCAFLFNRMTNTSMLHVPYKGVGQALADVIAKEVHLTYGVLPAVMPMIQAGRVRALGVTTRTRAALLPDVPAIGEVVKGYENFGWYSIVLPTGTPAAIAEKIALEVAKVAKEPEFNDQLRNLGIGIVGSTRAELDAFRADQTRRIGELVKVAGIDLK